jgi:hypothetical protein
MSADIFCGNGSAGQLNLSMLLLNMLARERGATSDTEVEDKASAILRELSRLGLQHGDPADVLDQVL